MSTRASSILPRELKGVMYVSGYRGIGKSFLAAQADLPQNIAFFDYENKGEGIDAALNFGLYLPITQMAAGRGLLGVYEETIRALENLEKDTYTVLVLDNISPLEGGMNAEAGRNAGRYAALYGLNEKNIRSGRFGGTRSVVNYMVSDKVCSMAHAKGVDLVVATAHVKERWGAAGPIPNKYAVKGADRWQELSILTLILIPGDTPPVPAALVQKEMLGVISLPTNISPDVIQAVLDGDDGHIVKRRLPFRIPQCTFQRVRWYLKHPANLDSPAAGESPTLEEADPFSAKLSKEQFSIMKMALEKEKREEGEEEDVFGGVGATAITPSTPKTLAELKGMVELKRLMEKTGLTLPQVAADVGEAWVKYMVDDVISEVDLETGRDG